MPRMNDELENVGIRSIQEACYWMTTSRSAPCPPLDHQIQTDVAIIGGGFTGLWSALFLKQLASTLDVVVLEREVTGYGGSGRNAGIVGETIDHSHSLAIAHFGFEEAARLAKLGTANLAEMIRFLTENGIDSDFEPTGRFQVALTDRHIADINANIEAAEMLGVTGVRFFNVAEAQDQIHSPLYKGAAFFPGGGILNPMKLVQGLKLTALRRGIRIYEQTPVIEFTNKAVKTEKAAVHCEKIVLATDAYTHQLYPRLLKYFIPLYDYIIVSEPLTDSELDSIGWKSRQGVTDCRTFFNYYRLTKDNRILWGTSEAKYYSPNRVEEANDHSEVHYAALKASFIRHFPQLADLRFGFAWGGPIASTTRLTPFFGSAGEGRILYALGYTGHGVASTRIAGKILAHMTLEKPDELLDLSIVRKKPFPYPPEPLRSWAVGMVTRSLRKVDEGKKPNVLLRILDILRIGFSS